MGIEDLTGRKFGRLTVLERTENKGGQTMWLCECECGTQKIVRASHLKTGAIQSCGCLMREMLCKRNTTHGGRKTRLYGIWHGMKDRCYDPSHNRYEHYGLRGIVVCDEWLHSFEAFRDWAIANGYDEAAPRGTQTIERINLDGNYCPDNCRWATAEEQANNKSNNHFLTYNGRTQTTAQWAKEVGLKRTTLEYRVKHGWSVERALTEPVMK